MSRRSVIAISTLCAGALAYLGLKVQAQVQPDIWPPRPGPPIPPPRPIPPRPLPPTLGQELQLETESAQVEIKGALARTQLRQTFSNPTNHTIEGTYLFPLPEGAAITQFAMTLNGKRLEAEILEGDKAREIYNGIVQKLRDPAILEFADRNLVRARLFPIPAGARPEVELTYAQTLKPEAGSFRYNLPLKLPLGGAARMANVDIKIDSEDGIRAVYSPTHEVEIKRDGNTARVTGEFGSSSARGRADNRGSADASAAVRDFVLYYTANKNRVGVNIVTHREPGEDGYFMVLAAPDPAIGDQEIAAKDVVFVCDTSGSMSGEKIEQARRALRTLLGTLNPTDRFGIVTFASDVSTFRDALTTADKATVDNAVKWTDGIKAVGGTNINAAVLQALTMLGKKGERPQQIVFMTDGQPTVGERDVDTILKNIATANGDATGGTASTVRPEAARVFVFGVGYDVNTKLLDSMAEQNRGASDYVLPQQDIETVVGSLGAKIAYPVLSNPRLEWADIKTSDIYPKILPDLFRGSQNVIFGRFSGSGTGKVTLVGTRNGREERISAIANFGSNSDNPTIPRLWAMRKVGWLIDDARRNNRPLDGEVKDEIVALSKRFGIVTPLTAGLITEDEPLTPVASGGMPVLRNTPVLGRAFESADAAGFGGAPAMRGAAGPTGQAAVQYSKATSEMRRADKIGQESAALRTIAGKSFILRNGIWTDTAYDAAKSPKPEPVKFASDEYFALVRDKQTAKWLSVGEHVIVVLANRTVEITP